MERVAKRNYDEALSEMRSSGQFREAQIAKIERAQIVAGAMEDVRQHAEYMNFVRHSPSRYEHVQSKVARNLKVQKSANRRTRKDRQTTVTDSAYKAEKASSYKWQVEDTYLRPTQSHKKVPKKHNFHADTYNVTPSF